MKKREYVVCDYCDDPIIDGTGLFITGDIKPIGNDGKDEKVYKKYLTVKTEGGTIVHTSCFLDGLNKAIHTRKGYANSH